MKCILVILSGGMDSSVLLYQLHREGHDVSALSFDYGQRHRKELDCARDLCARLGVPWALADLSSLRALLSSALTSGGAEVPDGHYAEASMKATVVPNRNMIMLSVAAGVAISQGRGAVAYAAHAGDHAIYPDCRPAFADALSEVLEVCDYEPVELMRPFVELTKADLVRLGHELGVPFEATWSCYKGGDLHCGACGTCVERREAFVLARGVPDPTTYAPDAPFLDELLARRPEGV